MRDLLDELIVFERGRAAITHGENGLLGLVRHAVGRGFAFGRCAIGVCAVFGCAVAFDIGSGGELTGAIGAGAAFGALVDFLLGGLFAGWKFFRVLVPSS